MKKQKVLLSWSGGKDSVVSLFELKSPEFKLQGLVTNVDESSNRCKAHQVRMELIEAQALSLEMPLIKVSLSEGAPNTEFETKLSDALKPAKKKGLEGIAFGDLHLEDLRKYREEALSKMELKAVFPVWKWSSEEVLKVFLGLGYKGIVVAVDTKKLPLAFVGRPYDREFVNSLPSSVDPCGENGEFHTFVYDGPFFQQTIHFDKVQVYEKNGIGYQDLKLRTS